MSFQRPSLRGLNFVRTYFREAIFFKNYLISRELFCEDGNYFREDGNWKFSRGLNFTSFTRSEIIQNLKTERSNSRPIINFETVEFFSKNKNCRAFFKHKFLLLSKNKNFPNMNTIPVPFILYYLKPYYPTEKEYCLAKNGKKRFTPWED